MATCTRVVSRDDAYNFLVKYFQVFLKSIIAANEELRIAIITQTRAKSKQRSTSSLMNDIVSHNLREQLSNYPDINFIEAFGQLRILFPEGPFLMKTKQSRYGRLSFISTQSMFSFMNQLSDMLPGMPPMPTNVVLSFQFNKLRTEIESVALLCPTNEKEYRWIIPIPFTMTPDMLSPIEIHEAPESPTEPKRITPKPKKIKKTKNRKAKKDGQKGKENKSRDDSAG